MAFSDDFVFSRGTGKTRINRAGLLVGVDFSSSSVVFGTGPKTFVLTADANVNRDWVIGSKVIAVSQAAPLGSMEGTVTSYNPATQSIVLEVTVNTGTGTGTNWRLGSLEITRNVLTGAVESHAAATNLATFSEDFTNAAWVKTGGTATANTFLAPNGSLHADTLAATAPNFTALHTYTAVAGAYYTFDLWLARKTGVGDVQVTADGLTFSAVTLTAQLQKFTVATTALNSATRSFGVRIVTSGDEVYVFGANFINGGTSTYIPTTTAQVTRAADTFPLSASAIARLGSSGTIYAEVETNDIGPAQKRAIKLSGPSVDIRLAKRGVGNFGGFTKQLEVEDVLYFGTSVGESQRDTGREITSFTATTNERTGLPETIGSMTALAWDGVDNIYFSSGAVESLLKKDLSVFGGKGISALNSNKSNFNGQVGITTCSTAGTVVITTDGQSYKRINDPAIPLSGLDVHTADIGGGVFRTVLVADDGAISYSDTNGSSWIVNSPAIEGIADLNAITFGAGLFVVGRGSTSNNIQYSSDGLTWTLVPGNQAINGIEWNGTIFVAVGNGGRVQTSANGISWTNRTSNTTKQLLDVTFANGLWVAVGADATIITSPDGITWTVRDSGLTINNLRAVGYFNGLYIAVGNANTIRTSPDGITWTGRTANNGGDFDGIMVIPPSVPVPTGRVVVSGSSGALVSSDDGTTYTPRSGNNATLNGAAYGAGTTVFVGPSTNGSGLITTISDSFLFTRRTSNITQSINDVRFIDGFFYGLANTSRIVRSADGISWTQITIGGTSFNIQSVAWNGSVYVAVGSSGRYSTSADGVVWTNSALTGVTTQQLNCIELSGGQFVAVGNSGVIITSVNGTTWLLRQSGTTQNLTSVMYSQRDQLWYAIGAGGTMLISSDAINWQSVQNATLGAVNDGTVQSSSTLGQFRVGLNRLAISYKSGEVITSMNGSSKIDTVPSIPLVTAGLMGENLNGSIRALKIYPEALTEAELNAMTGI